MHNEFGDYFEGDIELEEPEEDLQKKTVRLLSSTLARGGVSPDKTLELSNQLYDTLESASLLGNKIEYGKEDLNGGQVTKCSEDEAEFIRTVSEWSDL